MTPSKTLGLVLLALGGWAAACGRSDQALGNLPGDVGEAGSAGSSGKSAHAPAENGASGGEAVGGAAPSNGACEGSPEFQCLADCEDRIGVAWRCQDGEFTCAPGNVPHTSCPPDSWGACWWKTLPACYDSCEAGVGVAPVCSNGEPVCPSGAVKPQDCPVESCISGAHCCDPNGKESQAKCNSATSELAVCPNGGRLTRDACRPEGVTAENCPDLQGQDCASPDWVCKQGCTYDCSCTAAPGSDELRWSCSVHPC